MLVNANLCVFDGWLPISCWTHHIDPLNAAYLGVLKFKFNVLNILTARTKSCTRARPCPLTWFPCVNLFSAWLFRASNPPHVAPPIWRVVMWERPTSRETRSCLSDFETKVNTSSAYFCCLLVGWITIVIPNWCNEHRSYDTISWSSLSSTTLRRNYLKILDNPQLPHVRRGQVDTDIFPDDTQALAGAVFNTSAQFGAALGLAIMQVISTVCTNKSDKPQTEALMEGYRASFWTMFGFMLLCTVVSFLGLRKAGKVGLKRDWAERIDMIKRNYRYISSIHLRDGNSKKPLNKL